MQKLLSQSTRVASCLRLNLSPLVSWKSALIRKLSYSLPFSFGCVD